MTAEKAGSDETAQIDSLKRFGGRRPRGWRGLFQKPSFGPRKGFTGAFTSRLPMADCFEGGEPGYRSLPKAQTRA